MPAWSGWNEMESGLLQPRADGKMKCFYSNLKIYNVILFLSGASTVHLPVPFFPIFPSPVLHPLSPHPPPSLAYFLYRPLSFRSTPTVPPMSVDDAGGLLAD